jgi:hypothetical protein
MSDVTITVKDNGPYLVHGGASILDADGNEFDLKTRRLLPYVAVGLQERSLFVMEHTVKSALNRK